MLRCEGRVSELHDARVRCRSVSGREVVSVAFLKCAGDVFDDFRPPEVVVIVHFLRMEGGLANENRERAAVQLTSAESLQAIGVRRITVAHVLPVSAPFCRVDSLLKAEKLFPYRVNSIVKREDPFAEVHGRKDAREMEPARRYRLFWSDLAIAHDPSIDVLVPLHPGAVPFVDFIQVERIESRLDRRSADSKDQLKRRERRVRTFTIEKKGTRRGRDRHGLILPPSAEA